MKKWKHVRGSYAREIVKRKSEQKSGSGSKPRTQYMYFEQLRFLDPITKKTSDSIIHSNENASETELETTELLEDQTRTAETNDKQKKTKRTNKQQDDELIEVLKKRVISGEVQEKSEETDGDKLFLLSLLPEMKLIPQERKLKVRSDILSVIANAQAPTAPYIPPTPWPPQQSNPNQPPFVFPTLHFQSHNPAHLLTTHPTSHPQPTVNASFNQQHQFPTFDPQNMNNTTQPQQSNSRSTSTFSSSTDSLLNSPYDSSNSSNLTFLG